jgi:hypothetical protein
VLWVRAHFSIETVYIFIETVYEVEKKNNKKSCKQNVTGTTFVVEHDRPVCARGIIAGIKTAINRRDLYK